MFKSDIEGVEWFLDYEIEEELRDRMLVLELGVGLDNKGYLVFHEGDDILEEIQEVFANFTEYNFDVLKTKGKVEFGEHIVRYVII